ncbi:UNVERIFIED_CONTAM: hypothetical protein PYX00_006385 [Menopon gallinae]|uniref:Calponin-homology (CH) domain-containing protein n=1 Tax=Menopon gallinae TaxID=328185 RepID=A0AAW2HV51_9NEOP
MEITMRKICAHSFDIAGICVENIGVTPVHILLDLKEYPEYRISRNKEKQWRPDALEEDGILLAPEKSIRFNLHFEPSDLARYQFYLPLIINGILGPPMMQDANTEYFSYYLQAYEDAYIGYGELIRSSDLKIKLPCTIINCTVTEHLLNFSTFDVNFQRSLHTVSQFQDEDVELSNMHSAPLFICIRTDDINNKSTPFSLRAVGKRVEYHSKSMKLHLKAGETVTLRAHFEPVKSGQYIVEIPVFVRGYKGGYAYNFIYLRGELKKQRILSDVKEIHFPALPLRVGSETIFQIHAERYKCPDFISYSIPDLGDYTKISPETVKIVWLDEPKITGNLDTQSFAIQVSFQSTYPISLRALIIFSDTRGEFYPVLLTAVADNSIVTNYIFVSMRSNKYRLVRDEWVKEEEIPTQSNKNLTKSKFSDNMPGSSSPSPTIDPGPKLVVQMTKSMQRVTQLNFTFVKKHYEVRKMDSNIFVNSTSAISHAELMSDSTKSSLKTGRGLVDNLIDSTYPLFPAGEESYYDRFMTDTMRYVELWVYEVVFHCEAYLTIPSGFQMTNSMEELCRKTKSTDLKTEINKKTIIDLIAELAGPTVRNYFPNKPTSPTEWDRTEYLYELFCCLLHFLSVQGSFLPHVQPEHLLSYKDYHTFLASRSCEHMKFQGSNFHTGSSYRRISMSVGSGGSKSAEKDVAMGGDQSSSTLNANWSKSVVDENYDEETELRDRKNVEIDEYGTERKGPSFDYEVIKQYLFKIERMDKKEFNQRSTQAWLDVLIQIYRTLVLPKVVYRKFTSTQVLLDLQEKLSVETLNSLPNSATDVRKVLRRDSLPNMENFESNIYTVQERILLNWLAHHYEQQRTVLWAGSHYGGQTLAPRKIDNFRTDLSDSLVLMAVTASHCPYLIPNYFVDVFPTPQSHEQVYHNAIKLTSAWREVNIGLTVEPRDIVQSNPLFMLMVVCHLYEILPVLVPKSLIRFSAPLTQEVVRTIELFNGEEEKIVFEAKFIGTRDGSFRLVNSSTLTLKPNRTVEFKVAYRARRIHKVSVTLLLDGASVSPHFAKSMVFQLEGEPTELTDLEHIKLNGTLYKAICLEIPIKPPYSEKATYDISYSTNPPNDSERKLYDMKPWRDLWNRKTSRRLFLNQSYLTFNGDGPAKLNVTIACLTTDSQSFWLLFRSEVGDFIIRMEVLTTSKGASCGPIYVTLPKTWSKNAQCTCSDVKRNLAGMNGSVNCPLLCYLKVPSRNNFLWDTMFFMFQKTLDSKEKVFWKKHFETNIGIRLIKWLLSQEEIPDAADEFVPLLCTHVKYAVTLDSVSQKFIHTMPTLDIPDVRKKEPVYLPIHISNTAPSDLKVTLTMSSNIRREIRTIIYHFQEEKQSLEVP